MTDRSKWMEELSPLLGNKTLRNLVIPGAHDAGTALITSNSDWGPDANSFLHLLPKYRVAEWSRAQGWSLYQQLRYGIRYFDLRVAKKDSDSRLYFTHSLFGDYVYERIYDCRSFIARHPKELIILDFQHFYNMAPADHARLARELKLAFGDKLVDPPAPGSILPTLEALWSEGKQIVILYSEDSNGQSAFHDNRKLWRRDKIWSYWCEKFSVDDLRQCLQHEVDSPPPPDKLFVLQGVLSPNWTSLAHGSLQSQATSYNGLITSWFVGQWAKKHLNILMLDWVEYGDIVGTCIHLNGG